jgi:hypothetical protein
VTVAICIVLMNLYLMLLLCGIVSADPIDVVVDSRRLFCYVESRKKGGGSENFTSDVEETSGTNSTKPTRIRSDK